MTPAARGLLVQYDQDDVIGLATDWLKDLPFVLLLTWVDFLLAFKGCHSVSSALYQSFSLSESVNEMA